MKPLLLKFPLQGELPPGVFDLSAPAGSAGADPAATGPTATAPTAASPAASGAAATRPTAAGPTPPGSPTAAGPPVVCLHGTVASGGNWGHLATLMLARGRVVAAPTYGERGTDPLLDNYAEVTGIVRRVLEETGADQVDLVGHSQGGLLAGMLVAAMLRGDGHVPFAEVLGHLGTPLGQMADGPADSPPPGRPATAVPSADARAPAPLPPNSIRRVVCVSGDHRGFPKPRWVHKAWPRALFGPALADQMQLREHGVAPAIAGLTPGPDWIDLVTDIDRVVPASSAVTRDEYAAARTIRLEDALGRGVPHPRQPHDHGVGKLIAQLLADD